MRKCPTRWDATTHGAAGLVSFRSIHDCSLSFVVVFSTPHFLRQQWRTSVDCVTACAANVPAIYLLWASPQVSTEHEQYTHTFQVYEEVPTICFGRVPNTPINIQAGNWSVGTCHYACVPFTLRAVWLKSFCLLVSGLLSTRVHNQH